VIAGKRKGRATRQEAAGERVRAVAQKIESQMPLATS
jgi:hypothetical protein